MKVRGVVMARPRGQSWAPTPDERFKSERGNHPGGPLLPSSPLDRGRSVAG